MRDKARQKADVCVCCVDAFWARDRRLYRNQRVFCSLRYWMSADGVACACFAEPRFVGDDGQICWCPGEYRRRDRKSVHMEIIAARNRQKADRFDEGRAVVVSLSSESLISLQAVSRVPEMPPQRRSVYQGRRKRFTTLLAPAALARAGLGKAAYMNPRHRSI
eukprot:6182414-Pleurochrysis_carterae.AAC.3